MSELTGPVHVVGAGLLGTSIGLACRRAGLPVVLSDLVEAHVRTASGLGAGEAYDDASPSPQLVVVAVPPDHLASEIGRALGSGAVVTDVGSVKAGPLRDVAAASGGAVRRYVGGHPMAGSERSGPLAASAAMFDGRPWAVTPHPDADPAAVDLVVALAELCGGVPITMTPREHDRAVARTSHLPHLLAALVAGRLAGAPAEHLALSGQGVRDVTRVAGGDPGLWQQIVSANAEAVLELLGEVRRELDALIAAVDAGGAGGEGSRAGLAAVLHHGVDGTRAIPGKHGEPLRPTGPVFVAVPDHPGELARLFADAGESGVNIEDVHIDHDPGRPVGLLELTVAEDRVDHLMGALEAKGWTVHR